MRELAQHLGLSASTISLALRNNPRVALSTRQLVQNVAREKGYHLNPSVTSLMSRVRSSQRAQYTETLAWIGHWVPGQPLDENDRYYYPRCLWQGASERACELGYTLDSFSLAAPHLSGQRLGNILTARGIRGLLVPPLTRPCGHIRINWENFSAIALSHTIAWPQLNRVVPDHYHNIRLVLRTLRHRGYQRPGLLIEEKHDERCENRFRSAFYFHQQGLPKANRIPVLICPAVGYKKPSAAWLKKYRPDVVITLGQFKHLRRIELGDPAYSKNLGMVLLGYGTTNPGFAAVDENPAQIGAAAIDQLAALLSRNERGLPASPQSILIKGTWIDGQTLPPRPFTSRA